MTAEPEVPAPAVLCEDGTVEHGGAKVGFWWRTEDGWYCFSTKERADSAEKLHSFWRDNLKTMIPDYLANGWPWQLH